MKHDELEVPEWVRVLNDIIEEVGVNSKLTK